MPSWKTIRGHRVACALAALVLLAGSAALAQEEGAAGTVEHGMESAGEATQSGLERAGAATGRALQKALEKTGQGIGTAIEKTGEGLKAAGEALSGSTATPPPAARDGELIESDLPPEAGSPAEPAPVDPAPPNAPATE